MRLLQRRTAKERQSRPAAKKDELVGEKTAVQATRPPSHIMYDHETGVPAMTSSRRGTLLDFME